MQKLKLNLLPSVLITIFFVMGCKEKEKKTDAGLSGPDRSALAQYDLMGTASPEQQQQIASYVQDCDDSEKICDGSCSDGTLTYEDSLAEDENGKKYCPSMKTASFGLVGSDSEANELGNYCVFETKPVYSDETSSYEGCQEICKIASENCKAIDYSTHSKDGTTSCKLYNEEPTDCSGDAFYARQEGMQLTFTFYLIGVVLGATNKTTADDDDDDDGDDEKDYDDKYDGTKCSSDSDCGGNYPNCSNGKCEPESCSEYPEMGLYTISGFLDSKEEANGSYSESNEIYNDKPMYYNGDGTYVIAYDTHSKKWTVMEKSVLDTIKEGVSFQNTNKRRAVIGEDDDDFPHTDDNIYDWIDDSSVKGESESCIRSACVDKEQTYSYEISGFIDKKEEANGTYEISDEIYNDKPMYYNSDGTYVIAYDTHSKKWTVMEKNVLDTIDEGDPFQDTNKRRAVIGEDDDDFPHTDDNIYDWIDDSSVSGIHTSINFLDYKDCSVICPPGFEVEDGECKLACAEYEDSNTCKKGWADNDDDSETNCSWSGEENRCDPRKYSFTDLCEGASDWPHNKWAYDTQGSKTYDDTGSTIVDNNYWKTNPLLVTQSFLDEYCSDFELETDEDEDEHDYFFTSNTSGCVVGCMNDSSNNYDTSVTVTGCGICDTDFALISNDDDNPIFSGAGHKTTFSSYSFTIGDPNGDQETYENTRVVFMEPGEEFSFTVEYTMEKTVVNSNLAQHYLGVSWNDTKGEDEVCLFSTGGNQEETNSKTLTWTAPDTSGTYAILGGSSQAYGCRDGTNENYTALNKVSSTDEGKAIALIIVGLDDNQNGTCGETEDTNNVCYPSDDISSSDTTFPQDDVFYTICIDPEGISTTDTHSTDLCFHALGGAIGYKNSVKNNLNTEHEGYRPVFHGKHSEYNENNANGRFQFREASDPNYYTICIDPNGIDTDTHTTSNDLCLHAYGGAIGYNYSVKKDPNSDHDGYQPVFRARHEYNKSRPKGRFQIRVSEDPNYFTICIDPEGIDTETDTTSTDLCLHAAGRAIDTDYSIIKGLHVNHDGYEPVFHGGHSGYNEKNVNGRFRFRKANE